MRILTFLIFVVSAINMMAHGGHVATFTYEVESNQIILEFKIEKSVLNHFDLDKTCENYQLATAMCLVQYINAHTSLKIEGNNITFELQSAKQDEDFFSLKMIAEGEFSECEMIIENDCFYEYDRKFANRIILQKNEAVSSYLLDQKHKQITIH